jgi:predicted phage terminase large subunit-like protein
MDLEQELERDEDYDSLILYQLKFNYGDLLKVSRARGINKSLPLLRRFMQASHELCDLYAEDIHAEIEGQGLEGNALANELLRAQVIAIKAGDQKNSTAYSVELKKLITEGIADRVAGDNVQIDKEEGEVSQYEAILNKPLSVDIDSISVKDATLIREHLLTSFEEFSKWCFWIQMGFKFQMQDFHSKVFQVCQDIVDGKRDRVIVCIPPRHSKTQVLSIFLPLYSFCYNPNSHNIITSYADDVVQESSGYIRTIMTDSLFMKIFPKVRIDPNKRSLERWGTTKQGVMHAVPTGGKMTGKGAGLLIPEYAGVFVVDDVIKPKDAYSNTVRSEINDRYDNTFMSRLANDGSVDDEYGIPQECARTAIAIIMQRVHDEDLVGYLLRGNSTDVYDWLNMPAIITPESGSKEWYDNIIKKQAYTHVKPILFDLGRTELESALWAARKSLKSLKAMEKSTPYTFNSQYMGDPSAKGSGIIQDEWWVEYDELDKSTIKRTFMTADTASTTKTYSDYSVICYWGITKDSKLVLIDIVLGKWETPELATVLKKFWAKHKKLDMRFPKMMPRALYMEDKSSGQFLNQHFAREGKINLQPVPRDKSGNDKIARFMNTTDYFSQGRILVPANHEHSAHVSREILSMTQNGSGTGHDDVVDNFSDAVVIAFTGNVMDYSGWV